MLKKENTRGDKKSRFAKILILLLLFEESDEFHYSFVIRLCYNSLAHSFQVPTAVKFSQLQGVNSGSYKSLYLSIVACQTL